MIYPPEILEKMAILTATPEELLPLFSPMERAVITALKAMKNKDNGHTVAGHNMQHMQEGR